MEERIKESIPLDLFKQFLKWTKRFTKDFDKDIISFKTRMENTNFNVTDEENKLMEKINLFSKKIVSFSKDIYLLNLRYKYTVKNLNNHNFNPRWKPICLNEKKFIEKSIFEKKVDPTNRLMLLKKLTPSALGFSSKERTLGRTLTEPASSLDGGELNNNTWSNLYKAFKLDIYFKRENGEKIEIYKGGWNSLGEFHGFGMLFILDENEAICQAYRGDFFKGMKHGSGMIFDFEEFREDENIDRFRVEVGELREEEMLNPNKKEFIYDKIKKIIKEV